MHVTIPKIVGRYGIVTARLTDPLSQLTDKILNIGHKHHNAVGFYYESVVHGSKNIHVTLFNIYDNDMVSWLRMGITLDKLARSSFVAELQLLPLKLNTPRKTEDAFKLSCISTVATNVKHIADKNHVFMYMLLRSYGIKSDGTDFDSKLITGFDLVNAVTSKLQRTQTIRDRNGLIPCSLLSEAITLEISNESSEVETRCVVEDSRREISTLAGIFLELYTSDDLFREKVLNNSDKSLSLAQLENLFLAENELITNVVGGIKNGVVSAHTLNNAILQLSRERYDLGHKQGVPIITDPCKTVTIATEEVPCSYGECLSANNTDRLQELGIYINSLLNSFSKPEPLIINLGGIVAAFNNAVAGTNIPKISTPLISGNYTISRQCVMTVPGSSDKTEIVINDTAIPMYNPNLQPFSDDKLKSALIYADSLKDSSGIGDTRFNNLQNEIIHELAMRKRRKVVTPV